MGGIRKDAVVSAVRRRAGGLRRVLVEENHEAGPEVVLAGERHEHLRGGLGSLIGTVLLTVDGQGVATYTNGDVYEGTFRDGKREGTGTMRYATGEEATGDWINGALKSDG